jgi:predicted amidohydrolase YtcJ
MVIAVQTREVPISQWQPLLDQFSRLHHGQPADVETTSDHNMMLQAKALPLLGITAEQRRQHHTRIDILLGDPSGVHICHAIAKPARLRIAEWNDSVSALLEIESEDGRTTRVHVGPREQTLPPGFITDGLDTTR